ncbi:hypothetical protein [Streptomyces sp. BPTC-684]|uniref:hypothetical protein n=1 Tax=Streptomyces sp. BPTC-684 TaxID=3043734 RepID=UPI0024B26C3C|nr:hypothetical protein [Streptomyces sp. BPTC-684]WHM41109.1 hypothetical protein QIY60_32465 [Streptomyces sp. BPTC-684]
MRYTFPADLIEAQTAWYAAYRQLATQATRAAGTTTQRRRLQQLSVRLAAHPYWRTQAGRAPSARMALKELVRSGVRP